MQECAGSEQRPLSSGDLGQDVPILFLIVQGLCDRICRKDLFCPSPKCTAEIKSVSGLSAHLDRKHELSDVCCKDLMRCFIHGLDPGRINVILKTREGLTVNRLCDVARCPCLGLHDFHNRHYNVESQSKVQKETYVNTEALGWFWDTIRIIP
jgi:hypothetical protein